MEQVENVGEQVVAVQPEQPSKKPFFGKPQFSLPDRSPKRAKNGGLPIIQVVYTMGGTLAVETAVWENEDYNEREGCFETSYSISLPQRVRAIANNPVSQVTVQTFRENTVNAAMAWYDGVMAVKAAAAKDGGEVAAPGRLIRKRQPTPAEKDRLGIK